MEFSACACVSVFTRYCLDCYSKYRLLQKKSADVVVVVAVLSFNFLCAAVTKQYKLVPAIAGAQVGTPRDALVPYPWSFSVSQCLSEGFRNRDQRRPMCPRSSARTVRCVTYLICFIALGSKSYVKH